MKAVGIRELKAHLSRYLRDVQAGEVVLVTDRALRRLAEGGGLLVGEPHDPGAYVPSPVTVPEGTVAQILAAERDEG